MSKLPKGYYNKLLIMDSETTGLAMGQPDPSITADGKTYQAISWGFVVVDTDTYKILDELYLEIQWDGVSLWNDKAEQVHGLSKQHLEVSGVTKYEAAEQIINFLCDNFQLDESPNQLISCGGHNISSFDIYFLRRLLNEFDVMFRTGNRFVDTNTIGAVVYETYTSDQLFELVGVSRNNHNALDDAKACVKVLQTTRLLCRRMLQE